MPAIDMTPARVNLSPQRINIGPPIANLSPTAVVRPFFNGIPTSGMTFTGGPNMTVDADGVLQKSYIDQPAITGGRWATTVEEGAVLGDELVDTLNLASAWVPYGSNTVTDDLTEGAVKIGFVNNSSGAYASMTEAKGLTTNFVVGTSYLVYGKFKVNQGGAEVYKAEGAVASSVGVITTDYTVISYVHTAAGSDAIRFSGLSTGENIYAKELSIHPIIPQYLPTSAEGADLYTNTLVRGIKLYTDADPTEFPRYLEEPARTNKCTCRKANPTDTTNITLSGDADAELNVVTETEANLQNAYDEYGNKVDLSKICTSFKVYELDNSIGVTTATASIIGTTTDGATYSYRIFTKGSGAGVLKLNTAGKSITFASNYTNDGEDAVVSSGARNMAVVANAGSIVRFILPNLQEGSFCTSPIIGDDSAAAQVRQATRLIDYTAPYFRSNDMGGRIGAIPEGAGQTAWLWYSYVDADNGCGVMLEPTQITFRKRAGGVNTDCSVTYAHAADTPILVDWRTTANGGMGIRYAAWTGAAWSAWSDWAEVTTAAGKAAMQLAVTFEYGSANGSAVFAGNIQAHRPFWTSDIEAYLEAA